MKWLVLRPAIIWCLVAALNLPKTNMVKNHISIFINWLNVNLIQLFISSLSFNVCLHRISHNLIMIKINLQVRQ